MNRWLALAPVAVLAALGLLFGLYALKHDPHVDPQAMVGKPMPDVTLAHLDDAGSTPLRSLGPRPVLVNFFASWCAPCAIEHPMLMALKAQGVPVIGIAYKDEPTAAKGFLARLGDPFIARLADRDGRSALEFGVTGVPETYLIGADGKILAKHSGPLTEADAQAFSRRVLTNP